ncbi:MAG: hypothetical protein ACJ8CR_24495, partial [Roseiflexaceae bacterium]
MNSQSRPTVIDDEPPYFFSLPALKDADTALRTSYASRSSDPQMLSQLEAFLERAQNTGALLDDSQERDEAQDLLVSWTIRLITDGHNARDRTLVPYDSRVAPVLPDVPRPYPGIDALSEADADLFFGQQKLLDDLFVHVSQQRLLILMGPTASGKTSLIFGGLLPKLKQATARDLPHWSHYVHIVPGTNPLAGLARLIQRVGPGNRAQVIPAELEVGGAPSAHVGHATSSNRPDPGASFGSMPADSSVLVANLLANKHYLVDTINEKVDQPVLLIVDQFEELFTLCSDSTLRQAFVDNLLSLTQAPGLRHSLIISIRSNFDPYNQSSSELTALVAQVQPIFERSEANIPPLSATQLRETIVGPAKRVGLKFEDGLVDRLIQDCLI